MVAYNDNPEQNEDYQGQGYKSPVSRTGVQGNSSRNRPSDGNDTIDKIVQLAPINEAYQQRTVATGHVNYDLAQPLWFEAIMKKLAKDNAAKSNEKPYYE